MIYLLVVSQNVLVPRVKYGPLPVFSISARSLKMYLFPASSTGQVHFETSYQKIKAFWGWLISALI